MGIGVCDDGVENSIDQLYNYSDIHSLVPSKEELLEALKRDSRFEVLPKWSRER